MTTNNPKIIKTLKTISKVIGEPPNKNNPNNSTKHSKSYNHKTETQHKSRSQSHSVNKNYSKEIEQLRLFQEKIVFRKWLYILRLKMQQKKNYQERRKSKSKENKPFYDHQFVLYDDHFRIPPKNAVDRMRRILPNFEFSHIEEARRDKYDIKLLWPVNNILFPPKEKETRVHKIPSYGRDDYIDQIHSMNRLSKPKPDNSDNISNPYYRQRKISPKEALELCQRLNFKPSKNQNYDYLKNIKSVKNYSDRSSKKVPQKRHKYAAYEVDSSKYKVRREEDENLSDLTAKLAQNANSQINSSGSKSNSRESGIKSSARESGSNVVQSNVKQSTVKDERSRRNNTENSNNRSFASNIEENTELVTDSYLMDNSINTIQSKKEQNEEVQDKVLKKSQSSSVKDKQSDEYESSRRASGSNLNSNYSSANTKSSSYNVIQTLSNEEDNDELLLASSMNKKNLSRFEEEEESRAKNVTASSGPHRIFDNEEEESRTKNITTSSGPHRIFDNEEEEENRTKNITTSSGQHRIFDNEEEEESRTKNVTTSSGPHRILDNEEEEFYANKVTIGRENSQDSDYASSLKEEESFSNKDQNNGNRKSATNSSGNMRNQYNEEGEEEEIYLDKTAKKGAATPSGFSSSLKNHTEEEEEEEIYLDKIVKISSNVQNQRVLADEEEEEEEIYLDKQLKKSNGSHKEEEETSLDKQFSSFNGIYEEEEEETQFSKLLTSANGIHNEEESQFDVQLNGYDTNQEEESQLGVHLSGLNKSHEEEESRFSLNLSSSKKSGAETGLGVHLSSSNNMFEEEEDEYFANKVNVFSSHQIHTSNNRVSIEISEEEEDEIGQNDPIGHSLIDYRRVTGSSNIASGSTMENDEEESYLNSGSNYIRKSSRIVRTSTVVNDDDSPIITRVVKQFSHSTSNTNEIEDELFSDSGIDKGVLMGRTSSALGATNKSAFLLSGSDDDIP